MAHLANVNRERLPAIPPDPWRTHLELAGATRLPEKGEIGVVRFGPKLAAILRAAGRPRRFVSEAQNGKQEQGNDPSRG